MLIWNRFGLVWQKVTILHYHLCKTVNHNHKSFNLELSKRYKWNAISRIKKMHNWRNSFFSPFFTEHKFSWIRLSPPVMLTQAADVFILTKKNIWPDNHSHNARLSCLLILSVIGSSEKLEKSWLNNTN